MGWGEVVGGVIGALGSYASARQGNKPRNTTTNQTTTQTPYGQGLIAPGIEGVYNYATNLMQQGPRYISTGGHGGGGGGGSATPVAHPHGGGGGGAAPVATQSATGGGGRRRGGGGGGAGAGAATGDPISSLSNQIAQRGLAAGTDPTTQAAQLAARNILGGQGGADSGGTGYQGYNPISDALAQQLGGEVSGDDTTALLRRFLGGDYGQNGGGGGGGNSSSSAPYRVGYNYATAGAPGASGGGSGYSNGGVVPDSVANNDYYSTKVKELMDSKTNAADLQTLIDAQNADINKGLTQSMWDLDAQSQGTGRFGGDMWKGSPTTPAPTPSSKWGSRRPRLV
jgi:hypothetical protein